MKVKKESNKEMKIDLQLIVTRKMSDTQLLSVLDYKGAKINFVVLKANATKFTLLETMRLL